jgi:hypothetical protein
MRVACALICLCGLFAWLAPANAALDRAEARQLIVKYRHQWLADPDSIRDARIGEIFDIPFVGTAVCVAIDRALVDGSYSGLQPLLVIINKVDITPAPPLFQPAPKQAFEYHVTAAPPDASCIGAAMAPFPELRNTGGRAKR